MFLLQILKDRNGLIEVDKRAPGYKFSNENGPLELSDRYGLFSRFLYILLPLWISISDLRIRLNR